MTMERNQTFYVAGMITLNCNKVLPSLVLGPKSINQHKCVSLGPKDEQDILYDTSRKIIETKETSIDKTSERLRTHSLL
jgi:hypothetical protein